MQALRADFGKRKLTHRLETGGHVPSGHANVNEATIRIPDRMAPTSLGHFDFADFPPAEWVRCTGRKIAKEFGIERVHRKPKFARSNDVTRIQICCKLSFICLADRLRQRILEVRGFEPLVPSTPLYEVPIYEAVK